MRNAALLILILTVPIGVYAFDIEGPFLTPNSVDSGRLATDSDSLEKVSGGTMTVTGSGMIQVGFQLVAVTTVTIGNMMILPPRTQAAIAATTCPVPFECIVKATDGDRGVWESTGSLRGAFLHGRRSVPPVQ